MATVEVRKKIALGEIGSTGTGAHRTVLEADEASVYASTPLSVLDSESILENPQTYEDWQHTVVGA